MPLQADFKVLSAEVGFYQAGSPAFLLDVLTFNPASLPLFLVDVVPPDTLDYVIALTPSNSLAGQAAFDDDFLFRLVLNGSTARLQYCAVLGPCNWTTAPLPTATEFIRQPDGADPVSILSQTKLGSVVRRSRNRPRSPWCCWRWAPACSLPAAADLQPGPTTLLTAAESGSGLIACATAL
ncbi:MAG: hypothetical protein U5L74_07195 [Ideonella sp.]|nr:hypothetical protein [Ideonella sp.]